MIKRIFFGFWAFLVLLFLIVTALFFLSLPFIEMKTKARFGDDFVYVYDQSDGGQGHFPPSYACTYKFSEIPKGPLFDRVVMFKIGWHDWGQERRYMSRGAYLRPLHFGVVDKESDFYYWSYFAFDYVKPRMRKKMGEGKDSHKIVYLNAEPTALGRIGESILRNIEKCRAMASNLKEDK